MHVTFRGMTRDVTKSRPIIRAVISLELLGESLLRNRQFMLFVICSPETVSNHEKNIVALRKARRKMVKCREIFEV